MELKVELLLDYPLICQHEVLITYQEFEITRCTNFRTIEISYLQWKLLLIEVFLKGKYSNFLDFSVHFFAFWFWSFLYLFTRYILFVVQTFLFIFLIVSLFRIHVIISLFAVLLKWSSVFKLTWAESSSQLFWSPVVRPSVCKLFTFSSSSQEPLD